MVSVTLDDGNVIIKSGEWVLRENILFAPFFSITLDGYDAESLYDLLVAREGLKKIDTSYAERIDNLIGGES